MRILFVTRKFPPSVGGMEVFAEELAQALRQRCPEFTLVKPDPPIIGRPGPLALLRFLLQAARAMRREAKHADIALFGDAVLTPLAWLAKRMTRGRIATVVTAHGNDVYFASRRSPAALAYRTMLRMFAGSADLLIANSSDTRGAAAALGFRRSTVVPLATTPTDQTPVAHPAPKAILFAGRLIQYKGLGWFIGEVMPHVDPEIELRVAGPEWDAAELAALKRCQRARYLGTLPRAALPELRSCCIACIMPNLPASLSGQNEGFGLSALESAAVGIPVVASNLGGLAEAVVDGVTGFLVPALDAKAFAERINAIAQWSDAERGRFAAGARAMIAERFTWARVADDYLSQCTGLLQQRAPVRA